MTFLDVRAALDQGTFAAWPVALQHTALQVQSPNYPNTPLHYACHYPKIFAQIHPDALTKDLIETHNASGFAAVHYLAQGGGAHLLPKPLWTAHAMTLRGTHDYTPLHFAAQYGFLHTLPLHLLPPSAFLLPDKKDYTPLQWAAKKGEAHLLPPSILTRPNLLEKNKDHLSAWDYACGFETYPLLAGLLSLQTLQELRRYTIVSLESTRWLEAQITQTLTLQSELKTLDYQNVDPM